MVWGVASGMSSNSGLDEHGSSIRVAHLRLGWLFIFIFGVFGLGLEALHGFKVSWYLDVGQETRHLMLRLGHAHGTLLGLVNIAFALTVENLYACGRDGAKPSKLVKVASVLLPGGFITGGLFPYDGDPGLGILLVPIGAISLIIAAGSIYRGLGSKTT